MAVVAVKSAAITNRDATPAVLNNSRVEYAQKLAVGGIVAVTSGDSAASTYRFGQVPSNAVVRSIKLSAPDIGTTTTMDIGIYQTTQNGGAVVDADFFASAVVLNAGAINKSEVVNESGVYNVADMEKPLWQALGLTADSHRMYDIVGTLVGAADGTGSVLLEGECMI